MNRLDALIPADWSNAVGNGRLGLGLDVASTIKKRSNPSSLTITEQAGRYYYQRLTVRWKTNEYEIMLAIINHVLSSLDLKNIVALAVDNSNEKFAARKLKKDLSGKIRVVGIAGNSKVRYQGEDADAKSALGTAYIAALEDGIIAMPPCKWLSTDHRLVTRNGAKFEADVDRAGNHADTFDSSKLSYWALIGIKKTTLMPATLHF